MNDFLLLKEKLKHLGTKTISCGIHSGIPECCICFYITKWIWFEYDDPYRLKYLKRLMKYKNVEYVPCPKCLKDKKFIKTKDCPGKKYCYHRSEQIK